VLRAAAEADAFVDLAGPRLKAVVWMAIVEMPSARVLSMHL
jgi:hypothetical protein